MIKSITLDIFNDSGAGLGKKKYYTKNNKTMLSNFGKKIIENDEFLLGHFTAYGNDFQNQNYIRITSTNNYNHTNTITPNNLIPTSIYLSVRHCIKATWINDRDQFLAPNKKWEKDTEFQNDCLIFMLFHGQNKITCKEGINHFIPFAELELNAAEAFESHFMLEFIQGKIKISNKKKKGQQEFNFQSDELEDTFIPTKPLEFSREAKEVFKAAKELFKHYHEQAKDDETSYTPNAALYDIKAHFQGFNDKDKMNPPQKAKDEAYKDKLGELNYALKNLAKKIEVKVYEYEFLLE
ncbi:hypothetical protein MQ967_000379 [Campylobacter upsaliensis]|nr:hypothetical protein [Campylobacter upsaliensis]